MEDITKTISDIITEEELKEFYRLLPKFQEAQYLLNSAQENIEVVEKSQPSGNRPYTIEVDITATTYMKNNSTIIAPDILEKNSKKFYIDLITDNWSQLVDTFFDNVADSMAETCKNLYNLDEKQ